MAECSIEGCTDPAKVRGWCGKHYHRWQRHGDPLKTLYVMDLVQDRFWQYVTKTESCWIWDGNLNEYGYGTFHLNGRARMAHRVAYEWLVGPIPEGLELDHVKKNGCTNHNCVKAIADDHGPAHLEAVTRYENNIRGSSPTSINAHKTHCIRGHELSGENLTNRSRGGRECRLCKNLLRRKEYVS